MSKRGIQSASSTNCIFAVLVSKCSHSGSVTSNPASAPNSAIHRAAPASRSRPTARTTSPATIGTQMARERYGIVTSARPASVWVHQCPTHHVSSAKTPMIMVNA